MMDDSDEKDNEEQKRKDKGDLKYTGGKVI